MRILVDEMPKHESECPLHTYNPFTEVCICKGDGLRCDLLDGECRCFKVLDKPIKDDCK